MDELHAFSCAISASRRFLSSNFSRLRWSLMLGICRTSSTNSSHVEYVPARWSLRMSGMPSSTSSIKSPFRSPIPRASCATSIAHTTCARLPLGANTPIFPSSSACAATRSLCCARDNLGGFGGGHRLKKAVLSAANVAVCAKSSDWNHSSAICPGTSCIEKRRTH